MDASGPAARPLVRAVRFRIQRGELEERGAFALGGRRMELQASTIVEEASPRAAAGGSGDYDVWIVEGAEEDAPAQADPAGNRTATVIS